MMGGASAARELAGWRVCGLSRPPPGAPLAQVQRLGSKPVQILYKWLAVARMAYRVGTRVRNEAGAEAEEASGAETKVEVSGAGAAAQQQGPAAAAGGGQKGLRPSYSEPTLPSPRHAVAA